jgi:hypothetical protein
VHARELAVLRRVEQAAPQAVRAREARLALDGLDVDDVVRGLRDLRVERLARRIGLVDELTSSSTVAICSSRICDSSRKVTASLPWSTRSEDAQPSYCLSSRL